MFNSDVWFHCDIFFLIFETQCFFFIDFWNQIDFSIFFRFLKFVVTFGFHFNVIAQQNFQTFHKKKLNRIVIVICEEIYKRFVLICKKFDIKECFRLCVFQKTHTIKCDEKNKKICLKCYIIDRCNRGFFYAFNDFNEKILIFNFFLIFIYFIYSICHRS